MRASALTGPAPRGLQGRPGWERERSPAPKGGQERAVCQGNRTQHDLFRRWEGVGVGGVVVVGGWGWGGENKHGRKCGTKSDLTSLYIILLDLSALGGVGVEGEWSGRGGMVGVGVGWGEGGGGELGLSSHFNNPLFSYLF